MAKIKDASPIAVTRTNKTSSITIYFDSNEAVTCAVGTRTMFTQQAGINIETPSVVGTVSLDQNVIGAAIINKITDLNALIDAADNF